MDAATMQLQRSSSDMNAASMQYEPATLAVEDL
jgi:hypothetical protein